LPLSPLPEESPTDLIESFHSYDSQDSDNLLTSVLGTDNRNEEKEACSPKGVTEFLKELNISKVECGLLLSNVTTGNTCSLKRTLESKRNKIRREGQAQKNIDYNSPEAKQLDRTEKAKGLLWTLSFQTGSPTGSYSGEVCEGELPNGEDRGKVPNGRGFIRFYNSDTYDGPWVMGKMEGKDGVYTWAGGTVVYKGAFLHNLRHGHGELAIDGQRRYVGNFYDGKPNGYGTGYTKQGIKFHEGQWDNGLPAHKMIPLRCKTWRKDVDKISGAKIQVARNDEDDDDDASSGSSDESNGDDENDEVSRYETSRYDPRWRLLVGSVHEMETASTSGSEESLSSQEEKCGVAMKVKAKSCRPMSIIE
jgi:hypothetical protein